MSNFDRFGNSGQISQYKTLTDIEIMGLSSMNSLADGHAYQDLEDCYTHIISDLPRIWSEAAIRAIPSMEGFYKDRLAQLIQSPELSRIGNFKICPTASNSIDVVGAFLHAQSFRTALIEPTFDNLALLLRRRGVDLCALADERFQQAVAAGALCELPELAICRALFLVNPNNPTGHVLDAPTMSHIADFCSRRGITLLLDNSFRLFKREPYDDYAILRESGVSFIAFEDTGKVFPTQDLKASLLVFSEDNRSLVEEIYNEIYLCVSNFALNVLSSFFEAAHRVGLRSALWGVVDDRRSALRRAIEGSNLSVVKKAVHSTLGVEWIDCSAIGSDSSVCAELRSRGLIVLPGRQFYWNSQFARVHHGNIRISLLKSRKTFEASLRIIEEFCATTGMRRPAAA